MSSQVLLYVPLLAPLSLIVVSLIAWNAPRRLTGLLRSAWTGASGLGVAAGAVAIGTVASQGRLFSPLLGYSGLGASIRLDALSAGVFAMVALLVLVIARFSVRYLEGDERHGAFLGRLAATAAAVQVLVLANNLALFWAAWVTTSLCLHRLLRFYPERPRARIAARKKFVVARAGDLLLAGAFALLYSSSGSGELSLVLESAHAAPGPLLTVAGLLLAFTALLKSAQFPTHGWLVEAMETPTPVSALLHAGILNAGPFLVLRFSAIFASAYASTWPLLIVGGFTALFASLCLRTQPSAKVALGYSSAAHMGFTLFVCGLGVYSAATLHLVAHSFYKAHAFLSAGSTVDAAQASRVAVPPPKLGLWRPLAALAVSAVLYACVAGILGISARQQPELWLVGGVIVLGLTRLMAAGLASGGGLGVFLKVLGIAAGVTLVFFFLEETARLLLADSLPTPTSPQGARLALGAMVIAGWSLAVVTPLLGLGRASPWANKLRIHLKHGFYANALFDRIVQPTKPQLRIEGT
ncbi:MAG: proton-conducting transporter membrane subunit [Polyangiaceae bacterium]